MATEKLIFEAEMKTASATASVKSLKSELRQVTNELGTLEQGSEAFIKAAQKAGELQDKIGDVKDTVNAFNPEAKFQALAGVVGVAANGFAALQGATALFGAESEDLNKVMAKTQGAIALSSGLNGLLGMKDAFRLLGTQVIQLIPKLQAMGAAMVGAVTGGIAIAIVLIISYWKDLKYLITGSIGEVKLSAQEMLDAVNKGHAEYKKAAAERTAIAEREAKLKLKGKALDLELAKLDKQKKIDEAVSSGKLAEQKVLIEAEYQKSVKDINDKYAKEAEDKRKAEKKRVDDYAKERAKLILDTEEKNREAEKAIEEIALYNKELADKEKEEADKKALDKHQESLKEDANNTRLSYEERLTAFRQLAKEEVITATQLKDAEIAIEKEKQAAKTAALQEGANVLNQAAEVLGRNTAEGKALAVASATISTYLSAQKAFESFAGIPVVGFGLGVTAAGVAIASGLASVNKILAVPVPNSTGGGGGGGVAPTAPRIPQSISGTRLGGNSEVTTTGKSTVGKVYVTETDITDTQDKVKGIIRKATIK
jgi:hypothetical protein